MLHRVGGHATHSSTSVVRRIPVTTEEIQDRRFDSEEIQDRRK
jgi:hypothetical protein